MVRQVQSEKPAKPFGAPESDEESGGEEDADADDEPEPSEQEGATPLEKESEEKKKIKLHKGEKRFHCVLFFFWIRSKLED
jgi:DEAD/DEAH box helicase domain-containing protein